MTLILLAWLSCGLIMIAFDFLYQQWSFDFVEDVPYCLVGLLLGPIALGLAIKIWGEQRKIHRRVCKEIAQEEAEKLK